MGGVLVHTGYDVPSVREWKDPDDVWDVAFVWGDFVGTSTGVSFTAEIEGGAIVGETHHATADISGVQRSAVEVIRVGGGAVGTPIRVTSVCSYSAGLIERRSVDIVVQNK